MISTRQRKRFICVAGLIYLVCFVYLVCLVYLVYLVRFVEN